MFHFIKSIVECQGLDLVSRKPLPGSLGVKEKDEIVGPEKEKRSNEFRKVKVK